MKRIAMLLTAAVIAASAAILPASPASAHTDVCVGNGTATLTGGALLYVGLGSALANFTLGLTGACAGGGGGLVATGTVHGYCGLSTGNGMAAGHNVSWIGLGSMLVLFLEVTGVVNASVNVLAGASCTTGAASFLVTGGGAFTHGL